MYQQIIFEEGKEPRLHTSHQDIKSIKISDNSGKVQEISVMEFKDTRGDVFYAYNYAYSGKKPSNDEIYKAIDELKPIGEKFEMSKTISD
ncbi:putative prophage protein [Salmonella enterica]|nr:putative prophage protein [Salmonella enterica]